MFLQVLADHGHHIPNFAAFRTSISGAVLEFCPALPFFKKHGISIAAKSMEVFVFFCEF
jgi:hypothetical protein